jgi:hypothetical protein
MNQQTTSRGPNWPLLLLIPAAVIIAKGAARRRAMWESGWTPDGATAHRHGHGHGPQRRFGGDMNAGAFRLPPKIEWMLETWHTRAHEQADSAEATNATAPKTEEGSQTV